MAGSRWRELGLEESKNICGDFRPLTLLGEGTFGAVWAAVPCRQQSPKFSGESVAVKFINVISLKRQVLAIGGYLGRELAVIKLLAANPHANIVRCFGAFYDESFRRDSPAAIDVVRQLLKSRTDITEATTLCLSVFFKSSVFFSPGALPGKGSPGKKWSFAR